MLPCDRSGEKNGLGEEKTFSDCGPTSGVKDGKALRAPKALMTCSPLLFGNLDVWKQGYFPCGLKKNGLRCSSDVDFTAALMALVGIAASIVGRLS